MSPLRWTCESLRRVAAELAALGHRVSHTVVGELLRQQKFRLQANRKTREGDSHPDRDAQFAYINTEVGAALAEGRAVISVDAKKKELVGDFKNAGREWRRQGEAEELRVHDFLIKELGLAVPYGIYDLASNAGWVASASPTTRRRSRSRRFVGRRSPAPITLRPLDSSSPPTAAAPTAIASACGNASCNVWPTRPASPLRCITCPPGTSKWNKIEHRLFSFISQNWRAKPLVSYQVIIDLISATTTSTGLEVRCELVANTYHKGVTVPDAEMAALNIESAEFHGEWN
jgi:Rhodopirellula transposase DDE domain